MLRFHRRSCLISIALLLLLIFIAIFVKDSVVRPFFGDTLAVIWLYYTARSGLNIGEYRLSLLVLLFAYGVEFTQYLNLVEWLGLEQIRIVKIILGATFDWLDILAYTLGWFVIMVIIRLCPHRYRGGEEA